ncbi:hypothetical protein [Variovorax sp. KK3]|uniref:hypothetical protein n=1 Tax=Variovorax sp. KK3 TaxID=1855728 RepID=UPI00097CB2EE|nr:hypothetical protein [Variovorax sp. KK3]
MKQREADPAAGRAFRRMASLLAVLAIGGVAAIFVWVKEPPGTTISPNDGVQSTTAAPQPGGRTSP